MREDLAAMGQPLTENDFYAIILGSLLPSYDPYISAVNATSSVLGKTISADDLMLTVTEEYEHWNLRSKTDKKDDNAAFYSTDSGKEQRGGSSSKKKNWNVTTAIKRVITNWNVGLQAEEKKAKGRTRRERENPKQTTREGKKKLQQQRRH